MAKFEIEYGKQFLKEFPNFPSKDQDAIAQFIEHIINFGFFGLEGRNKNSDNVDKDDPHFSQKVKYAQDNALWHYHIGILRYDHNKPFGDRTSEYVLHYQRFSETIKIVDYTAHPPFRLPKEHYLI